MKKGICLIIIGCALSAYCFAQTVITVTVEVTNIVVNGGKIYLALFKNADGFKNEVPDFAFILDADNTIKTQVISLPAGEYVVSAFQDANNNVKLDYGLLGVPKELVGISNYSGKGFPSKSFDKQKIMINNTTGKVTIGLYKF